VTKGFRTTELISGDRSAHNGTGLTDDRAA
jgi:hypothetical protein